MKTPTLAATYATTLWALCFGCVQGGEKPILTVEQVFRDKIEGQVRLEFTVGAVTIVGSPFGMEEATNRPRIETGDGKFTVSRLQVIVDEKVEARLNQLGIEDLRTHFYGKLVRVSGKLKRVVDAGGVGNALVTYSLTIHHVDQLELVGKKPAAKSDELKMSIRIVAPESTDTLRFHVTFDNAGDKDAVLNLGMMLANGKVHHPDAVRLILTTPGGQSKELLYMNTRVAGRVDDYVVPLRAGSAYTVKLSPKDFWCKESNEFSLELAPGKYGVRGEFIGQGAQYVNGDTEGMSLMHFWKGKLQSEVVQFQVGKQG